MAFSGMGSNGGRGGRGRWRSQVGVLAEMNVVPLVDVVLVLLIIFMVTASVMEFGLNIDVPQVKQVRDTAEEHPVIGIARSRTRLPIPSRSRMDSAPGLSVSPQSLSRGKRERSMRRTSTPARAMTSAATLPAGPAPTTRTPRGMKNLKLEK